MTELQWYLRGTELCPHCLQKHLVELSVRCAVCDCCVCVYCVLEESETSAARCPECPECPEDEEPGDDR